MEDFRYEELVKLLQKSQAKEVKTVEVQGGRTLEVLLKYQHHSFIPKDVRDILSSYQSYSPKHVLLAANFCSKCFYHFSQGSNCFCANHPQMQQPRKRTQAQMEQPTDTQDKGKEPEQTNEKKEETSNDIPNKEEPQALTHMLRQSDNLHQ